MNHFADASFFRSLIIQARVIGALLLREVITRYGRHGLGVLWLILEPMLFTLGVSTLWYLYEMNTRSSIPIIAFAITGYSSVLMWRNASSRCAKAIEPNFALMYHRNVTLFDIFLSRVMLEWVGSTASLMILTIFFTIIGEMGWPEDLLYSILGWLLLAWFSFGLGLIVGVISERSELFERTWQIFTYLLFPLSGAVFMVHWLPKDLQEVILWIPMIHGTEMLRHGFFGTAVPTYEIPFYFIAVNLFLTLIGLSLVRGMIRGIRSK